MFFCAISGSPPTVPVVSRTSGTVYEKALIERYIEDNGTDPITGEPLTKEDLIDVKAKPSTLPPRPANQTSIPALLIALQSEYDAIMLESLEIKKSYQASRQELANALYREDAASRVIGRLMKERDEAREALASIQKTIGFAPPPAAEETAEDVEMGSQEILPADVKKNIMEMNASLMAVRKKRKPPQGYVSADTLKTFTQTSHVPSLHATKPPGISCLDLSNDNHTIVTGGPDKIVQIFDLDTSKVTGTLKGHTKAVTHVSFRANEGMERLVVSGSQDKTVRVWNESEDGNWSSKISFTGHKGEITGISIHPTQLYAGAASTDSTWSLYDLNGASKSAIHTYSPIGNMEGSFSYTSFSIHPDGVLVGGGVKNGHVRIWDARQADVVAASVMTSASHDVTTISFSENGYYLAAASSADPTVTVFDLRKQTILSSWALPAENTISEVRFDPSAQFLSVAGTDLRLFANKSWDELYKFEDNAGVLTGARFSSLGEKIVLSGMDRTVRVLSAST